MVRILSSSVRNGWLAVSVALRALATNAASVSAADGSSAAAVAGRRIWGRRIKGGSSSAGAGTAGAGTSAGAGTGTCGDNPSVGALGCGVNGFPGILFDIDGVFKHGGAWDPAGLAVLGKCVAAGVPFAFVTNGGGGKTEGEYAAELKAKLVDAAASSAAADFLAEGSGVAIDASHMVLSYTPWARHLDALKPKPILVIGDPADKVLACARAAGFTRAVHVRDYARAKPTLNPFQRLDDDGGGGGGGGESAENAAAAVAAACAGEPFAALCVFTDPLDFFEALQVRVRALQSPRSPYLKMP